MIPNGIAGFAPGDGARVREELGIAPAEPLIGSVGHLRPEKAFEVLIEALALLGDEGRPATALIAGEGPERGLLESLIADSRPRRAGCGSSGPAPTFPTCWRRSTSPSAARSSRAGRCR